MITLADRILEFTNTISAREAKPQILDSMELEQERGITIKLNAIQIKYKDYIFHLIDTPGHVDFTYEVSRSLAACEGALLLVDATQGIQAQTLANVYMAMENNLEIVPIINKVDLISADPERVKKEIQDMIGIDASDAIMIINRIPAPKEADINKPLQALIFDSYFDNYRGVVIYVRLFDGKVKVGDEIYFMQTKKHYLVTELGVKNPNEVQKNELQAGEVG